MLSEKELIDGFKSKGTFQGGELYLDTASALEFLDASQRNDMAVIGVEAFRRDNGHVTPLLDQIADFSTCKKESWPAFKDSCSNWSKEFIEQLPKGKGVVASFTLMTKSEWKHTHNIPRRSSVL